MQTAIACSHGHVYGREIIDNSNLTITIPVPLYRADEPRSINFWETRRAAALVVGRTRDTTFFLGRLDPDCPSLTKLEGGGDAEGNPTRPRWTQTGATVGGLPVLRPLRRTDGRELLGGIEVEDPVEWKLWGDEVGGVMEQSPFPSQKLWKWGRGRMEARMEIVVQNPQYGKMAEALMEVLKMLDIKGAKNIASYLARIKLLTDDLLLYHQLF